LNTYHLRACTKCHGALVPFDDERFCLNCGKVYYPDSPDYSLYLYHEGGRKRREVPHYDADQAEVDIKWMLANGRILQMIKAGLSTGDISMRTGVEMRQVRAVRERLVQMVPK
jgi:hypothetical protein